MKSQRHLGPAVALAAALILFPASSFAFGLSGIGGKIGITNPDDVENTTTFGGHLEFEQAGSRWHILPGVMYWSEDGISDLNPNFDVYYHFTPEGTVAPYLGAGIGVHMYDYRGSDDGDTDVGANLFGGLRLPISSNHLFLEGRYVAAEHSQLGILGGVTFHLH